ncbi:MAG: NADH-quinone oxidoreductase subunit C [Bacteroidota bacterium]|nr:NADH-quinone oxidoreductase subunit C [Bacteroidota bacterium]MDE2955741.1 NADH-quinone oxidoreductase subunit C [Bacteroidota bacterium]
MSETLKFHFTPVDSPKGGESNLHAKDSTAVADVIEALREQLPEAVTEVFAYAGEYTAFVRRDHLLEVCRALKEEFGFTYLTDLAGVDRFTDDAPRYEVYYSLVNIEAGRRIRLKVRLEEDDAVLPSVEGLFKAADWNERECYDMLGIRFDGHPDLRRMYMPEDFEYHPLRKEFPLLGIPGSLPLPPQVPEGKLTRDPFAAAHGMQPPKSYREPKSDNGT